MSLEFDLLHLFLVRDLPKIALMLLVFVYLLLRILRMPEQTSGRARALALIGIAMLVTTTLSSPILYALAAWTQVHWMGSEIGYAVIGGVLTLMQAAGILLLGLAVLAGRQSS